MSPASPAENAASVFERITDALVNQRWIVIPEFFPSVLVAALYKELLALNVQGELNAARVGKDDQLTLRKDIRGDAIHWLDGTTEPQRQLLAIYEQLRCHLNQTLYLGLNELEAHYALYPPGAFYQQHLDSFNDNNLRRITVVTYLNPDWQATDGGELNIFQGDQVIVSVLPQPGTLVCFVSEEIPHEVALTHRQRASIAGWYRVRDADI